MTTLSKILNLDHGAHFKCWVSTGEQNKFTNAPNQFFEHVKEADLDVSLIRLLPFLKRSKRNSQAE